MLAAKDALAIAKTCDVIMLSLTVSMKHQDGMATVILN